MGQTYDDYVRVVVNGGDPGTVDCALSGFQKDKMIVIHDREPRGMEAASNRGIRASDSVYVAIHDDDDTWHPDFLRRTVLYLDLRGPDDIQQGVMTHSAESKFIVKGNGTGNVVRFVADISKAREKLGYEPQVSFMEGIDRSIAWYKRSGK